MMHAKSIALTLAGGASLVLLIADCAAAEASMQDFSGVWQVSPRGPEGAGRRGPGGSRPRAGSDDDGAELGGPDIEGLDRGDRMTYRQMTAAGKAAFEHMNPRDLPANNCKSNGLPSLVGIPDVQEWSFKDGALTIHYADFDTYRTIHLDGLPVSGPPSLLGYSSGTFDKGVFTVTTTNLVATPGGLGRNAPGSASRSYIERYELTNDGTSLRGTITIRDPDYLMRDQVRPIVFDRAPEGTTVPEGIPCDVAASQRYLD